MSDIIETNGIQCDYNYFSSVSGYKCCTKVEHNINLCHNCNTYNNTIDIPQTDPNCHVLMMHLYNNDTLVDLSNVSCIQIKFICGNKTVIGDYRKTSIVNCSRGLISYLLDADTTGIVGTNQIELTLTIGSGTVTFNGTYNVVSNIQTNTDTVVLPDTPRDDEYIYGPHCRHILGVHNCSNNTNNNGNCNCDCCQNSQCVTEDDFDASNVTLRDLYFSFMAHTKNPNLHINSKDRNTLNSSFKTVNSYSDLLNEIGCNCNNVSNNIVDGRIYRVKEENKYYEWNAQTLGFDEITFGNGESTPVENPLDVQWKNLGFENVTAYNVGDLDAYTDISELTLVQILAKILGLQKLVPVPNIIVSDNITLHNTHTVEFNVENLLSNLDYQVDLNKISISGENSFQCTKLFDNVSNKIIITIIPDVETSDFHIIFDKGVVTQTGNANQGYAEGVVESETKSSEIHIS